VTADQKSRLKNLRLHHAALRKEFESVTQEYKAGRISLSEQTAMLAQIIHETNIVADEMAALVTAMSNPLHPDPN